eukprot:5863978-Ditylum_brightwellii.AAC.1
MQKQAKWCKSNKTNVKTKCNTRVSRILSIKLADTRLTATKRIQIPLTSLMPCWLAAVMMVVTTKENILLKERS